MPSIVDRPVRTTPSCQGNHAQRSAPRRPPALAVPRLDRRGRPVARARHRRQHRDLQRRQRPAADLPAGAEPGGARALPLCGAQRHGDELERLWLPEQDDRRPGRPGDVLLSDVPAVRRRQPVDDGPAGVRADRARQRLRRRTVRNRGSVHLLGQLLPDSRRARPYRPDDPARRRSPDSDAGRGDQLEVLALALRHRSGGGWQGHQGQQRAGHNRRRDRSALQRHSTAGCQAAGHFPAARARPAAEHQHGQRAAAPGAGHLLVAAGDGAAEAGHECGPGPGQPRGRVPADGEKRPRQLPEVAFRRGAIAFIQQVADGSAAPPRRAWRPRVLRHLDERVPLGRAACGRRRARPADRLRQRRQPAAVACDHQAEGVVGAAVARRDARAAGTAAADGKPAAGGARRCPRRRRRLLGQAAAAGRRRRPPPLRLACAHVRVRRQRPDRTRLRHPAGAPRHRA